MLKVILTELGIGVFDGDTCMKTIIFSQPADDYIFIKKGKFKSKEQAIGRFFGPKNS